MVIGIRCLILEEINGVGRVMPEQVIRPRPRLAEGVHVGASKEIGLHVHLLDFEFALGNTAMYPLVRRIESSGMTDHANEPRGFLRLCDRLGISPTVGQRNLNLHVFAGMQALECLMGVHLRGCAENRCLNAGECERLRETPGHVADAVLLRRRARHLKIAADE